MIVIDIESSGIDTGKCGIWQIGAVELENSENRFLEEARIDDEDEVNEASLKVTGKTEEELRDKDKQSQMRLIQHFIEWAKSCKIKIPAGQNIGWDLNFLQNKCIRYGISKEFAEVIGFKGFDLYIFAQLKHFEIEGRYRLRENGRGSFTLPAVLKFCGLENPRMELKGNEVVKEGTPHHALEDCKLEGECFSRIMNGRGLFPEYSKFKIPDYLERK